MLTRESNLNRPLIVDPDHDFLESIRSHPRAKSLQPVLANTGAKAQTALADRKQGFSGIFVNPDVAEPHGLSVIRFAHLYRPAVPIFLICNDSSPFTEGELKRLAIQRAVSKPLDLMKIMELIAPLTKLLDLGSAVKEVPVDEEAIEVEISREDSVFYPVQARNFLSGAISFFDVYIRLASGKYVKILKAGDAFSAERVASYLNKNVENFYLRNEAQKVYLSYCDQLTSLILKQPAAPLNLKVSQTLNHGEQTISYLRAHGLNEDHLQFASSFVNNVHELVKRLNQKKHPVLDSFLADLVSYEHGVATSLLASLLNRPLKLHAQKSTQIVGLASLFHDIGLQSAPPALRTEDEDSMSQEQLEIYSHHPEWGGQILKEIRGIEPVVYQAVEQHHERRNKKGFPNRFGAGEINRVAEIVGLCDEIMRFISHPPTDLKGDPFQSIEESASDRFSPSIMDAFRVIFIQKK